VHPVLDQYSQHQVTRWTPTLHLGFLELGKRRGHKERGETQWRPRNFARVYLQTGTKTFLQSCKLHLLHLIVQDSGRDVPDHPHKGPFSRTAIRSSRFGSLNKPIFFTQFPPVSDRNIVRTSRGFIRPRDHSAFAIDHTRQV
jgi:hypothetical protein